MLTYGFYDSVAGDRRYNAVQMAEIFDGLINDGVYATQGTAFVVNAQADMNVTIGEGRAWFDHTWTKNDTILILTADPADLILDRIDTVVLEVNSELLIRQNSIKIIKGTPSSSPTRPDLTNNEYVHQYPLADIAIAGGVTSIIADNITNRVGTSDCPFVTGIIDTINIDTLLSQWEGEFNTWFASIKDVLDENTAGNLLNLINANTTAIDGKADRPIEASAVLDTAGWVSSGREDYTLTKTLTITGSGILSTDRIEVIFELASLAVAGNAELASTHNSVDGGIQFWCNVVPSEAINFDWRVVR